MSLEFDTACHELGSALRLTALTRRIHKRPASPELDAAIALEVGWLKPYSHHVRGGHLITGVVIVGTGERFPLNGPWFARSRDDWWNSGKAIADKVQKIPNFSSDVSAALQILSPLNDPAPCSVVVKKSGLWAVEVLGHNADLVCHCTPGADTLAKAFLIAGIDWRLRSLQNVLADSPRQSSVEATTEWETA
jgi:hypothetical protein